MVVADIGAGRDSYVNSSLVAVQQIASLLEEDCVRSLMDAAEGRSLHVIARVAQAKTNRGLRKQDQVVVIHPARGQHFMRRVRDVDERVGRIKRIGQQVIVPDVLVTPEAAVEVVPFVLGDPQAGCVFGIPAPAETAHKKIVEQYPFMVERSHAQSLFEQARPLLLIEEGIINRLAPIAVNEAIAELE